MTYSNMYKSRNMKKANIRGSFEMETESVVKARGLKEMFTEFCDEMGIPRKNIKIKITVGIGNE